jgi:primosomal protein N'
LSAASSTPEPLVHVAVPVPSLDLLTYAVPAGVAVPSVGARVVVPLGTRVVTGIVIEVGVSEELGAATPRRDQTDSAGA